VQGIRRKRFASEAGGRREVIRERMSSRHEEPKNANGPPVEVRAAAKAESRRRMAAPLWKKRAAPGHLKAFRQGRYGTCRLFEH